ncbi:MAG: protein kinase [Muribaculaceae bacterium]|nr:protein kinase [Muribaculaceae bacterium]
MQLKEGSELQSGKYCILRVLGQGGFGITYLAENLLLGKKVAIKEFFPKDFCGRDNTSHLTLGTQNNAETVSKLKHRFLKEAQNISKLNHPGIVHIHDMFEENNTAYYVMDYIEGENLNEIVKRNGALPEDKAVKYIEKVGKALEYIHSQNMTHFDVKPANIVVRKRDDQPILIDFGLSKQFNNEGEATSTLLSCVSHGYSPIELYKPQKDLIFSPQSDVYSLAATLFYLLYGETPPSSIDCLRKSLVLKNTINLEIRMAIQKGMAVKNEDRFDTPSHFINALTEHSHFIQSTTDSTYLSTENNNKKVLLELFGMPALDNTGQWFMLDKRDGWRLWYKASSRVLGYFGLDIKTLLSTNYAIDPETQNIIGEMYDAGILLPNNLSEAIKHYELAALNGDADAEFNIGRLYFMGRGVIKDVDIAFKWFEKAAKRNNANAQIVIGWYYHHGLGVHVKQNFETAFNWYLKAGENGQEDAMADVKGFFNRGLYVKKNNETAFKWTLRAAERGFSASQKEVGDMYKSGVGVIKDYSKAFEWYLKAAEQGNAKAMNQVALCHWSGKGVTQDYVKANEWFVKSAEKGYHWAQKNLAESYRNGKGVEQDFKKAFEWYLKAAEQGNAESMINIGLLYSEGKGVTQDYAKAHEWFVKSAEKEDIRGVLAVATSYESGKGVEQDFKKAFEWYLKAAEQGNPFFMNKIALMYWNGKGVTQDYVKANEWFLKAAEKGYDWAQKNIADSYRDGTGVKNDYKKALGWYRKAAEQGNIEAKVNIGNFYYSGKGIKKNRSKAKEFWESAAKDGNLEAKQNIRFLAYRVWHTYLRASTRDNLLSLASWILGISFYLIISYILSYLACIFIWSK